MRAAGYVRLSREDNESLSIENQKEFLSQYCLENGIELVEFYADDGYTGTNFERPGFKKMICDAEDGFFDTIVVKDLSRLGRDYIETGYYIEKYFPQNGLRFIAAGDGIDTLEDNDITPFKAVINDMYAKDISKKVRAVFLTKMKNGYFISASAPYGYKIDPNQKGRFVIDVKAAEIVKRIFDLYLNGETYTGIARLLTDEGVLSPGGCDVWHPVSVRRILGDKSHIGCVVQNKTSKISYKIDKYRMNPKEKWIIVPDMHEAIVDKRDFEIAQKMLGNNNVKVPRRKHVLAGLIYCEKGHRISFSSSKGVFYTVCQAYKNGRECSPHMMKESKLEKIVQIYDKRTANLLIDKIVLHEDKGVEVFRNNMTAGTYYDGAYDV